MEITPEQANKIECALLQLEYEVAGNIGHWDMYADEELLDADMRETAKSNANWWREVYALIYGEE